MKKYTWPLNINNFGLLERLKICSFILNPHNRWTQDKNVYLFERKMAEYISSRYAVYVSSGSTANTILAMRLRDKLKEDPQKNIVVLPSTTWQTSCSPWAREGFEIKFIDVSLDNFCMDMAKLENYIKENKDRIACVFITSLIGFVPNITKLLLLQSQYDVNIMIDNCESTFGSFCGRNISSFFTSTTSTYFGHQIQSIEGGFIFTNDKDIYEYALMARNHGMVRGVDQKDRKKYTNPLVDASFDFYLLGNNFRNTDLNAYIGMLDFKKIKRYTSKRERLYELYAQLLDNSKFLLPFSSVSGNNAAFCLPIVLPKNIKKLEAEIKMGEIKAWCVKKGVEYRPIISGFLGYQTCYKKLFDEKNIDLEYENSIHLNNNGIYVGLYPNLPEKCIKELTEFLNNLKTL
jgi:CDP-4-dehydro-6-deoxyglucose reductase, E1